MDEVFSNSPTYTARETSGRGYHNGTDVTSHYQLHPPLHLSNFCHLVLQFMTVIVAAIKLKHQWLWISRFKWSSSSEDRWMNFARRQFSQFCSKLETGRRRRRNFFSRLFSLTFTLILYFFSKMTHCFTNFITKPIIVNKQSKIVIYLSIIYQLNIRASIRQSEYSTVLK